MFSKVKEGSTVAQEDIGLPPMDSNQSYVSSSSTVSPLLLQPTETRKSRTRVFDNFRSHDEHDVKSTIFKGSNGRVYNNRAAATNSANTSLVRVLKGRHLQMIAIGGSIGTGLFVSSGAALQVGGPASLLIAYLLLGGALFCTVQALGEMAVAFPVAGSFSTFATRFIDPACGFATGMNYALRSLIVMPLEIIAASITLEYWNLPIPHWVSISVFLIGIVAINLCEVKVYGEAEYGFSILKVTAIIGFIILGAVINCTGTPTTGYIGGRYWSNPGAFNHGFKGFCNTLVTAAFAFAGTELVALAAAETYNPSKSLPTAIKQVFWRIVLFYVLSIVIIGLLVPYDSPSLITTNSIGDKASPFIIAIQDAGITGLDSVMNAVILIAVLSVANSCMYGSSRLLASLAAQGQAPRALAYIDRKGRPLVALGVAALFGLLAFLYITPFQGQAFTWMLALSGLSAIFTWGCICYSHIRFRAAWLHQGNRLDSLIYQSPIGSIGSWIGLIALALVLVAQFWVAISPVGIDTSKLSTSKKVSNFFEAYLALPVVAVFYVGYKWLYRTKFMRVDDIDLVTGRNEVRLPKVVDFEGLGPDGRRVPRWKKIYKMLC